jgi:flagellin
MMNVAFQDSVDNGVFGIIDDDNFDNLDFDLEFEEFLDMVKEIMDHTEDEGLAGRGLWFHIGANQDQGIRLEIDAVNVSRMTEVSLEHTRVVEEFTLGTLRNLDLTDGSGVMRADGEDINRYIFAIDASLAHVAGQRAHLGAVQNRLEFTVENLQISSENLSAANSRIRDADMAKEMMAFTQANVLQQAAISMLAQANQAPQSILSLLR